MTEETCQFSDSMLGDSPMMAEQEAMEIIYSYNRTILTISNENKILQSKLNEQEAILNELIQQNMKHQENQQIQIKRQSELEQINEKNQEKLQNLMNDSIVKFHYIGSLGDRQIMDQKEQQQDLNITFNQINQENLTSQITPIDEHVHQIMIEIQSLQNIIQTKSQYRFCSQCRQNFIPQLKSECCYHPGKMKFYSCRKCGADEYFQCCLKCSKCCKGCRWGDHLLKP